MQLSTKENTTIAVEAYEIFQPPNTMAQVVTKQRLQLSQNKAENTILVSLSLFVFYTKGKATIQMHDDMTMHRKFLVTS